MNFLDNPAFKPHLEAEWLANQFPSELPPEKNLMASVLMDAVRVALRPDDGIKLHLRERQMARQWIVSRETERIFCFINICEVFNFDPKTIRKKIMGQPQWKKAA